LGRRREFGPHDAAPAATADIRATYRIAGYSFDGWS
jgi:hypothetical protein